MARLLDSDGYQVCKNCETNECARFDVIDNDLLDEDQECCICDPDSETCSFCASMM